MTYKHTPEPWYRDEDGFIASGSSDTYVTIADPNCSDMDIDEREANASLIAAAPDLLFALEFIVEELKRSDGDPFDALHDAEKAINKAKGKS